LETVFSTILEPSQTRRMDGYALYQPLGHNIELANIQTEVNETTFPMESANPNVTDSSPLILWSSLIREAAAKDGIDADPTLKFQGLLEEIGFINIRVQPLKWPIGPWAKGEREKLIGRIMVDNVLVFIRPSAMMMFTKRLGWSTEQVEEFLPGVESDTRDWSKCIRAQM
jgi:hypothetical protein